MNESIDHFIFDCPNYHTQRQRMFCKLNLLNINNNLITLSLLLTGGNGSHTLRVSLKNICFIHKGIKKISN